MHDMTPSKEYLADLIWLRHFRRPVDVWLQGLLVVAQFSDHTTAVHRLETLEQSVRCLHDSMEGEL